MAGHVRGKGLNHIFTVSLRMRNHAVYCLGTEIARRNIDGVQEIALLESGDRVLCERHDVLLGYSSSTQAADQLPREACSKGEQPHSVEWP